MSGLCSIETGRVVIPHQRSVLPCHGWLFLVPPQRCEEAAASAAAEGGLEEADRVAIVRGLASVAAMLPMDEAQAALAHLAGPAIATIQRAAAPQVNLQHTVSSCPPPSTRPLALLPGRGRRGTSCAPGSTDGANMPSSPLTTWARCGRVGLQSFPPSRPGPQACLMPIVGDSTTHPRYAVSPMPCRSNNGPRTRGGS